MSDDADDADHDNHDADHDDHDADHDDHHHDGKEEEEQVILNTVSLPFIREAEFFGSNTIIPKNGQPLWMVNDGLTYLIRAFEE